MYEFLKVFSFIALPFLIIGILISLIVARFWGNYHIYTNMISDLGTNACSPSPNLFNYTLMISAFLMPIFYYYSYELALLQLPQKTIIFTISFILLLFSSICLFFVGFFNLDVNEKLHSIFAFLMFFSVFIGEMIMGMVIIIHTEKYLMLTLLILSLLTIGTVVIIRQDPISEWIFFFALIGWAIPLIIEVYNFLIYS